MAKKTAAPSAPRKPRLLWANPYCLLDTSSGASMSIREMLRQLVAQGYEVKILGGTLFDNPKGANRLQQIWQGMPVQVGQFFDAADGELIHQLLVTANTFRDELASREENAWLGQYVYLLDSFKPDVVWFYGGYSLDLLIADEARTRGIPSAFYLVNGNYLQSPRWCRDIDLILTDSQNTADLYRKKIGFVATPIGKFIDPACFVAERHERRHLLFVNPSWEKGAAIVVQLALMLEQRRPDITLEVVEARADWSALLQEVTSRLGTPRTALSNVVVTGNTSDMRPVYERARVLLTPSLWWESGARVLAEAMLNGIPAIVSNHGGSPGLIDDGGIVLDFPAACHEKPYQHIPHPAELQELYDAVVAFYDDQALYDDYVARARRVGREKHHISVSTRRLTQALAPLVGQKAGDKDFIFPQRKQHKHRLAGIAVKPEHLHATQSALPTVQETASPGEMTLTLSVGEPLPAAGAETRMPQSASPSSAGERASGASFDWQLDGQIVVLDNRASLLRQGAALKLLETGAFAMLAFDPGSEVKAPEQYAGNPNLQVFPHALLGDGRQATLHACLDAAMSSTLQPLPAEHLPEALRQGAAVLTRLPINSIALDSIEGLPSVDWLILDALSDTLGILEHGRQALQQALLIQVRLSFQASHQGQCTLQQLRDWADSQGFHFLRLNAPQYRTLFPAAADFSSQLESAEALLIPGKERLAAYPAASRKKLAFLLHAVFDARDAACRVLESIDPALCSGYLQGLQPTQLQPSAALPRATPPAPAGKPLSPDELLARLLPVGAGEAPGSVRWLIDKEQQFGGIHHGVVRSKTSPLDPRKPEQYSAGFVRQGDQVLPTHIGGDRMSLNYHGYSIAYSGYLAPFLGKRREERLVIVEIGILRGIGLAIWCDLFPNARVIGLDLDTSNFEGNRATLEAQGAFRFNQPEVHEFDQFADNRQKLAEILGKDKVDIVIDDGAHTLDAIMMTFQSIKKSLAADYVYFIEDFRGIEAALRKMLPGKRVAYRDEMTVISPNTAEYPKTIPSVVEFVQSLAS